MYKIVSADNQIEVWASGFKEKSKAQRLIDEGHIHKHMYQNDKNKKLVVVPENESIK